MGRPKLCDISHNRPHENIELFTDKFEIGRGHASSLVIADIGISRTHCVLECTSDNEWIIFDMSSNGTRVNGRPLEKKVKHKLNHGDVIGLSDSITFLFKMPEISSTTLAKPFNDNDLLDVTESLIENIGAFMDDFSGNSEVATSSLPLTPKNIEVIGNKASTSNVAGHKREASPESKKNLDVVAKKMKLEDSNEELQCSICTELFIKAQTLACSHTFCKFCIEQWKKKQNFCPICRTRITTLFPTLVIDSIIEKVIESSNDEIKEQRRTIIEERNAIPGGSNTNNNVNMSNAEPIVLSDDDNENSDDDDYWEYSSSIDYEDDEEDYGDGAYYGGYGRCYICNRRGHWANGCPVRRTR